MVTYTITLTDVENKALSHFVVDPQDWIENFVKLRCSNAVEDIFQSETRRMLEDESIETIPADRTIVVQNANIKSAKEIQDERLLVINNGETPIG